MCCCGEKVIMLLPTDPIWILLVGSGFVMFFGVAFLLYKLGEGEE
jgi:hypothetical protein